MLTLYTLTWICIFFTLFFIHFLRCWQGEFVCQSRGSFSDDHFLYSHDLNVWFSSTFLHRIHVNLCAIYIISSVMHAFWLVLTYDLLEDRRIDDVIIKTFFNSLLYKTNRFQVAVRLFSNRSQRMSKCGKNISDTLGCTSCATFLFLPHFDVICDLLMNRCTATWNLFVKWIHIAIIWNNIE